MAEAPARQDPEERVPLGYLVGERFTQPQFILALMSFGLLYWLTRELLTDAVPDRMREVISVLVGFITGQMVGPGWQFYFGTTQGSEKKTSALQDNAATLRRSGDLQPKGPLPVIVDQPPGHPVPVVPEPDLPPPGGPGAQSPDEELFKP